MKKSRRAKQPPSSIKEEKSSPNRSLDDLFHAASVRLTAVKDLSSRFRHSKVLISAVLLMIVALAVLLPFTGKAYHIDDPLLIWAAKQIRQSPLDPYGFQVNWYGTAQPMWDVTKNPPLASYCLALVSLLTGWGEAGIHLAMILFPALTVIGIYNLSRKFCLRPLEAALASLLTPVFLVSGTTVMCDIAMLCFWVWAVFLWMEGLDTNRRRYLLLSSILLALAALTKYYGIALIPLLLAYTLARTRRMGYWALYFLIPLAILCAYQWTTELVYGRGLLSDAAAYAHGTESDYPGIAKGAVGLVFTGGCLIGSIFYAPFLWPKRSLFIGGALIAVLAALLYSAGSIGAFSFRGSDGMKWSLIVQFSLLFAAGINILSIAALDLWNRRDAESLLLVLWIFGTFIFAVFINWTINGRSILPMVPALSILIMRKLEAREKHSPEKKSFYSGWALIPALIVAVSIAWADYTLANASREAALVIEKEYRSKTGKIWFQGHWGFQYYMESMGAESVDPKRSLPSLGDIVAVPMNGSNLIRMNPDIFALIQVVEIKSCGWLATMREGTGAGFYSDVSGPLPFVFGPVPPEKFHVWVMNKRIEIR